MLAPANIQPEICPLAKLNCVTEDDGGVEVVPGFIKLPNAKRDQLGTLVITPEKLELTGAYMMPVTAPGAQFVTPRAAHSLASNEGPK
jgi:hypothetical protein